MPGPGTDVDGDGDGDGEKGIDYLRSYLPTSPTISTNCKTITNSVKITPPLFFTTRYYIQYYNNDDDHILTV